MKPVTLALVHGAGTGAWVWDRTRQFLKTPSIALDVPSRVPGATPQSCADALARALEREDAEVIVPVLHSLGGVLASSLAARLGARIKRFIFLAALVPPHGRAVVHALGPVNGWILRLLFRRNPDGLQLPESMIRKSYCNDLDEQTSTELIAKYAAEFPGLYLSFVAQLPPASSVTYVKLLDDRSVGPKQQDKMLSRLPAPRVVTLQAGHLAMLSQPSALARILDDEAQS